jgi:hypothetical protein
VGRYVGGEVLLFMSSPSTLLAHRAHRARFRANERSAKLDETEREIEADNKELE